MFNSKGGLLEACQKVGGLGKVIFAYGRNILAAVSFFWAVIKIEDCTWKAVVNT